MASTKGKKEKSEKLKLKEDDVAGKGDIPTQHDPNAIAMGAGEDGEERTQEEFQELPLRDRNAVDEQFPTAALQHKEKDDAMRFAKLQLQDEENPGMTPFGMLIAKDEDFKWLQRLREKEAEANFQQWFATNFDKMSPEQKQMARDLYPDFYQQRLKLLSKDLDLIKRIAALNVHGIRNAEDLKLQYAIEAGYIEMERLENIMHPEKAILAQQRAGAQAKFVRGLFNPKRLPRQVDLRWNRPANSQRNMNRNAPAYASNLGWGQEGFSATPVATAQDESLAAFDSQFAALQI